MFTAIYLIILAICLAVVAYCTLDKQYEMSSARICSLLLFLFLLLFATFRNGDVLPDYDAYCKMFASRERKETVEWTFYLIKRISFFINPGGNVLILFFIYALLGVSAKFYAIRKYSPYQVFSLFIWCCSFYLLEDLIQIRAAVAGGLLMLLMPQVAERRWHYALPLFVLAFWFHNSAIIFLLLFFLKPNSINKKFWFIGYLVAVIVNVLQIDFYGIINYVLGLIPSGMVSARFHGYVMREYQAMGGRVNLFSPYTLLQSFVCLFLLWRADFIKESSPYAIIWLKVGFVSVFIYSLSITGVTMRLSELLAVVHVFLMPLLIDAVPNRYRYVLGGGSVILLGFLILSNFVFLRSFIYF